MNNHITTIIFDLDGTLLDTLADLTASVNHALGLHSLPTKEPTEVRRHLGNGIRFLVDNCLPSGLPQAEADKVFADFREHYMLHCLDKTCPYDGTLALLDELKKSSYKLAIVSNKVQPAVTDLRNKFFASWVDVAIGESDKILRKPAPDSVYEALRQLKSNSNESIYIGDSEVDMQTARNAGLPCISVLWGFRDRDFLMSQGATNFAEKPSDITAILKQF